MSGVAKLLVVSEKHGNRYFYIPDMLTLYSVALSILSERLAEGYWYHESDDSTGMMLAKIKEAVQKKNGLKAWDILTRRCDFEYENVQLENFEQVAVS